MKAICCCPSCEVIFVCDKQTACDIRRNSKFFTNTKYIQCRCFEHTTYTQERKRKCRIREATKKDMIIFTLTM